MPLNLHGPCVMGTGLGLRKVLDLGPPTLGVDPVW